MKKFSSEQHPNSDFNQYWYSDQTVETLVNELIRLKPSRIACLSTPSVFFRCCEKKMDCDLFDFDDALLIRLSSIYGHNLVFKYDYRDARIGPDMTAKYDAIVCDPPFISADVLSSYCRTIHQLMCKEGKVIFSSIAENESLLQNQLSDTIRSVPFKPSIPSLVYQYQFYVNYTIDRQSPFAQNNAEISTD